MSKCIYSYEDGDYCLKHSHGAADIHCTGEDGCPDFTPNKTYTIGKPFRITADMIGETDFSLTKDLIQRIVEAHDAALENLIKANTVVINGHRYGMLKNTPGFIPTIFGMRVETIMDMPDKWDFLLQERPPEPMTNADRIRAMTIEELATAMYKGCGDINWSACRIPKVCEERGVISLSEEEEDEICVQCWIDWLKSPAEVEADDG